MSTKAIDQTVTLSDGIQQPLSQFWRQQPVILVFLRHFG